MKKFKIYQAGKMSGLTMEEMNEWREEATNRFEFISDLIQTLNPCHFYNFEIDPSTYTDFEVKEFDLWLVKNCDLVLVNLDYPDSIGTAIELHMAQEWKIPVISFGTAKNHPWIELCITKRCETLEDAIDHICKFYVDNA